KLWADEPSQLLYSKEGGVTTGLRGAEIGGELAPEMLGVGYLIGPRIASLMIAGAVLSYFVLGPLLATFGEKLNEPISPAVSKIDEKTGENKGLIRNMGPGELKGNYLRYIGAGAVAAGGIISMCRALPLILASIVGGLRDLRATRAGGAEVVARTERDLSMYVVLFGSLALVAALMFIPSLGLGTDLWGLLGALMILVFGFLFVTVSSRLTGEIGSSSNPISGMTVATLLLTCLIFLVLGWTGSAYYVTALSIGGIVCIAASNGGTTSQDLKTGYLVGSTPRNQQIAILIGAFASALILGPILLVLNNTSTVYVPRVTFKPVKQDVGPINAGTVPLQAYTDTVKPPAAGNYRVIKNEPAAQGQPPPVAGLEPGEYMVNDSGKVVFKMEQNFPAELRAKPDQLDGQDTLKGPQANDDKNSYRIWQKTDTAGGPAGRYLVDTSGVPVYLTDPGINGTHKIRPDGSTVTKYDAPK